MFYSWEELLFSWEKIIYSWEEKGFSWEEMFFSCWEMIYSWEETLYSWEKDLSERWKMRSDTKYIYKTKSATTGVWSDGRSSARGPLSIQQPVHLSASFNFAVYLSSNPALDVGGRSR